MIASRNEDGGRPDRTAMFLLLLLLILTLTTGCSGDREQRPHLFEQIFEEGIPTAVTRNGPRYTHPLFYFEPILQLTPDPDRTDSYLRYPRAFYRDGSGRYLVPHQGEYRMAVFDSTGEYRGRIALTGEGPGEFLTMVVRWLVDDQLVITDSALGRTTVLDAGGLPVRVIVPPAEFRVYDVLPAEGERFVAIRMTNDRTRPEGSYTGREVTVYSADWREIWSRRTEQVLTSYTIRPASSWSPIWYTATPIAHYEPGRGILLSAGGEPLLEWFDLDGKLLERIRLEIPADVLPDSLKASIRAGWDRVVERAEAGFALEFARDRRRGLIVADVQAFWDEIEIDAHGYYWCRKPLRIWDSHRERVLAEFRLLSPAGEYLGDVTWPVMTGRIQDGQLMGIYVEPETGEQIPTVYRIRSAVPGFDYP